MPKQFDWQPSGHIGFCARMPSEVTLYVTPDRTTGFAGKPARGTTWRAGVSQWDASTRTVSRYGRDVYGVPQPDKRAAKKLAEQTYLDATPPKA